MTRRPTLIALRILAALVVMLSWIEGRAQAEPEPGAAPPPVAEHVLDGIDVSHWQGTIDWSQVSGAGKTFAILKATEGQTFDDPNYASYRSGANSAGMFIGAYHFARPDSTADDATIEADHYTGVASPKPGDIVPVL